MIAKLFMYLTGAFPSLRRFFWKSMYNFFTKHVQNRSWRFMNFGYAYLEDQTSSIHLRSEDIPDTYSWQIYEHMLRVHPPDASSHVLEVGSGRGGACFLMHKYYQPRSVTGVDLSDQAVAFCHKTYQEPNLQYVVAPADNLPIQTESMDLVINAESSHAYPDFNKFVAEVYRVLKPGGLFMTTDNRKAEKIDQWKAALLHSGLTLHSESDITDHVLKSLDEQESIKANLINKHVPSYFKKHFKEFAGMKGSVMYDDFLHRRRFYKSFILHKKV